MAVKNKRNPTDSTRLRELEKRLLKLERTTNIRLNSMEQHFQVLRHLLKAL